MPPSLAVMSPGEPQALPPCLLAPFTILSHRAALFFCSRESCSGAGRAPGLPLSGVLSPALWGKEQSETRDVMPACAQGSKSCSRQGHLVGCIPLAHQKPCIFGAASGLGGWGIEPQAQSPLWHLCDLKTDPPPHVLLSRQWSMAARMQACGPGSNPCSAASVPNSVTLNECPPTSPNLRLPISQRKDSFCLPCRHL